MIPGFVILLQTGNFYKMELLIMAFSLERQIAFSLTLSFSWSLTLTYIHPSTRTIIYIHLKIEQATGKIFLLPTGF